MATTNLIKFCGFIVHSKPNNMTLSAFPGKPLKLENSFLIFCPSLNVPPKRTDQSRSHSISMVHLQVSLANFFFVFDLRSKLRVVHIRIKIKIFIFPKMASTIFINFVGILYIRTSTIWHYLLFPEKSL